MGSSRLVALFMGTVKTRIRLRNVQADQSATSARCKTQIVNFFMLEFQCVFTVTKKPPMKELTKKERKNVRKTMKSNFEQIKRSKRIWEELRRYT